MSPGKIVFMVLATAAICTGIVYAADQPSVEKGKIVFNDPKLGSAGKSCNNCHVDGKGLDKAGAKQELPAIINTCITKALQGAAIDANSLEMKALVLYIKTLEKKPAKKKAAVGC